MTVPSVDEFVPALIEPADISKATVGDVVPIPTLPRNIVVTMLEFPKTTVFDPSPVLLAPITISLFVCPLKPPTLSPNALYPIYIDDVIKPVILLPAFDPNAVF